MKVFTSPVLRVGLCHLDTLGKRARGVIRLSCLQEFVDVPRARYYDLQVSRQQWADESGVEVLMRHNGVEWLWHSRDADSTEKDILSCVVDDFLTKCFGEPRAEIAVYWRLRYWN